jgi:hypothetical protein
MENPLGEVKVEGEFFLGCGARGSAASDVEGGVRIDAEFTCDDLGGRRLNVYRSLFERSGQSLDWKGGREGFG